MLRQLAHLSNGVLDTGLYFFLFRQKFGRLVVLDTELLQRRSVTAASPTLNAGKTALGLSKVTKALDALSMAELAGLQRYSCKLHPAELAIAFELSGGRHDENDDLIWTTHHVRLTYSYSISLDGFRT